VQIWSVLFIPCPFSSQLLEGSGRADAMWETRQQVWAQGCDHICLFLWKWTLAAFETALLGIQFLQTCFHTQSCWNECWFKKNRQYGYYIWIDLTWVRFLFFFFKWLLESTGDRDKSDILQVHIKHFVKSLLQSHLG